MSIVYEQDVIETPAGEYTVKIIVDEYPDQPYNEGFILVTNGRSSYGYDSRIDIEHGDDPLMTTVKSVLADSYQKYGYSYVSGTALVRWLKLHGRRGVTIVGSDYTPEDASTDREDRIHGVAWAPDDATDPDAYTKAGLSEWSAWAEGDVFGWVLIDPSGETVESLWGYYGHDEIAYMKQEAQDVAVSDSKDRIAAANTVGAGFVGIL